MFPSKRRGFAARTGPTACHGTDAGSTRRADASRPLSGQCVTMDCRIRGTEQTQSSQRNGAAWPRCGGRTHEERPSRSQLLGRCR
jgi:hypothetical protein